MTLSLKKTLKIFLLINFQQLKSILKFFLQTDRSLLTSKSRFSCVSHFIKIIFGICSKTFQIFNLKPELEPEANVENVVPCISCQYFRDSVKHKKSEACSVHSIELNSYSFSLCFTVGPATLHLALRYHIKCKKNQLLCGA